MSNKIFYRQCFLKKQIANGTQETTSWIPDKFAKIGMCIKLKDDSGIWSDGWIVQSASHLVEEDNVPDYRKSIRNHKHNTGDSQPKRRISEWIDDDIEAW